MDELKVYVVLFADGIYFGGLIDDGPDFLCLKDVLQLGPGLKEGGISVVSTYADVLSIPKNNIMLRGYGPASRDGVELYTMAINNIRARRSGIYTATVEDISRIKGVR